MEKKYTSVQMFTDTHKLLKKYAKSNRKSISSIIDDLILEMIDVPKKVEIDPNKIIKTTPVYKSNRLRIYKNRD